MTVPIPNIYHIPDALPFPVSVALTLARRAHPLELRRKPVCGPQVPYLAHPVLACKILLAHGIDDPVTLMAALLHDAVEKVRNPMEGGTYVGNLEKLQQDLQQGLIKGGYAEPDMLAAQVAQVVEELTPPTHESSQGKLSDQLVQSNDYTNRAKLVKMADHAATLVDDLFVLPKDNHEKRMRLLHRVRSIADKCQLLQDASLSDKQSATRLSQYVHWLANETTSFIQEGKGTQGETPEELQTEILSQLELHLNLMLNYHVPVPKSRVEKDATRHGTLICPPGKCNGIH